MQAFEVRLVGCPQWVDSISMGNTELKRVEEQLQTNGAGLSHILESARLGVWDWNIVTGDLLWSRECLEMFGLPPDTKMNYERFLEAIHPEDRERVDRATRTALETRSEYSTEMRAVWPDGSIHWIASRGRAYYDESGKPLRMSGAGMDITQFKRTEEERDEARTEARTHAENLAAVLDAVPAATFLSNDRSCTNIISNRAAYNLLRLPYGSNTSKSAPPAERPTFSILENGRELPAEELPVQLAARTGREVRNKLLEIRFADGKQVYELGHAVPLFDEAGQVRGAVGAFLDVTELKNQERELERARAESKAQADNLAATLSAVPALTFIAHDRECRVMTGSGITYELLNLPPGSNLSQSATEGERPPYSVWQGGCTVPPQELPMQQAAATGQEIRNRELKIEIANGNVLDIFGHAVPLFDEAKQVRGAVGAFLDITGLKQNQEELERARAEAKAQSAKLSAILDSVPAITLIAHDRECKHITSSRFGYEVAGLPYGANVSASASADQHQGFALFENGREISPQDAPLQKAARTGQEVSGQELRMRMADGREIDLYGRAVPLFDESGEVRGAVGAYLDITQRKQAEENLRQSEERLRLAAKTSQLGFHDYDAAKDRSFWTPEVYALTGIPEGTEIGMSDLAEIIHPEDRDHVLAAMQKALEPQGNGDFSEEFRIVRRDNGEMRWILNRGRTFFKGEGAERRPVRNTGIVMDITDRKRVEEALRRSEEDLREATRRFELALRDTPITVFTTGTDLRYKWVYNPVGPDSAESLIGKRDSEILERAEDVELSEGIKREVLRTGIPFNGDMTVHFKGVPHTYHVNMEATRDAQGQIVGLVCACIDLTEQKGTQAELEKLSRQRQLALDAAKMGWWHYDPATHVVNWDDTFRSIFGLEATTMPFEEILHRLAPEYIEEARAKFMAAVDPLDPQPYCMEYPVIHPDGSVYWVEAYGKAEFTGAGPERRCIRCSGTVRDITERKQAAEALRQQRDRYEFVAEASDVGFWFCDLPFDKVIWDKRVKRHFWLPPDDSPVTMETFYSLLHPEDRESTRRAIENSIANNEPYDVEYRTVSPEGQTRWVRANGRPSYNEAGRPVRFDGVTLDITKRKRTEDALRTSEARYRTLFETMTEGFVLCELLRDEAGRAVDIRWLECNPALERLTGLKHEQVVGHRVSEVFPEECEWWVRTYERVVDSKTVYRFEQGSDSVGRVWDLTAFPYEGDRFAVIYDDITSRKKAEEILRTSEARYRNLAENLEQEVIARTRDLEVLNDGLRALSIRLLQAQDEERRRIARDLHDSAGQILTALGLELSALEQQAQDSTELGKQLQASQDLVQMLHKEIRTTSYLLHPPLLDETGLVSALSWYVQGVAQRSGIDIRLDIAEDFGRLPREIELVVFRLVQESLTNIHRHSGSKTASIRIARSPALVTVEVQDQGKGISPRDLQSIRQGGSGVGIRGMRERLRQFGGDLNLDSSESGTRVRVNVPIPQETTSDESGFDPLRTAV